MINIACRSLSKIVASSHYKKCKQAEWHSMSSCTTIYAGTSTPFIPRTEQWRSQPRNLGGAKELGGLKCLILGKYHYLLWKNASQCTKWLWFLKVLGGAWPLSPPWLRLWSRALQRITRKTFSLCKQETKDIKITGYVFFSCKITASVIEQLNLIKHLIDAFHALTWEHCW